MKFQRRRILSAAAAAGATTWLAMPGGKSVV